MEIGKTDMSNAKYRPYFEEAKAAIMEVKQYDKKGSMVKKTFKIIIETDTESEMFAAESNIKDFCEDVISENVVSITMMRD